MDAGFKVWFSMVLRDILYQQTQVWRITRDYCWNMRFPKFLLLIIRWQSFDLMVSMHMHIVVLHSDTHDLSDFTFPYELSIRRSLFNFGQVRNSTGSVECFLHSTNIRKPGTHCWIINRKSFLIFLFLEAQFDESLVLQNRLWDLKFSCFFTWFGANLTD